MNEHAGTSTYPLRVEGELDGPLSRWLWLFKWLLVIPHVVVLAFLWVAFIAATIVAFFAILFTGRHPLGLFDFKVGVLRWSWRVAFYSYNALGTDRYPPFTLADVPGYPARLHVERPGELSRKLVLVKWWLLALPHFLVVGVFTSGAWAGGTIGSGDEVWVAAGGLVTLLCLIAGVTLLVTAHYPRSIFELVMGLNRWTLRVVAYATLMTDEYPPFRLDMGGAEPVAATTGAATTAAGPAVGLA